MRVIASVVIPAHNEEATIGRTLGSLAEAAATGELEVVVVCNGCTDETAARAAAFPGVRVIEAVEASKVGALNAGDAAARHWPRFYLDADISVVPRALEEVARHLNAGGAMAARPSATVDTSMSRAPVRRYYRARMRMPSMSAHLWGAGIYALSEAGHERLGSFPDVIADDLYVDALFGDGEKCVVPTVPVIVQAPRDSRSLLAVLTRARRGPAQQRIDTGSASAIELLRTIRGPVSGLDAVTFAWFAVRARRHGATGSDVWERDESSRTGGSHE